jgi:hypothetical protein
LLGDLKKTNKKNNKKNATEIQQAVVHHKLS